MVVVLSLLRESFASFAVADHPLGDDVVVIVFALIEESVFVLGLT